MKEFGSEFHYIDSFRTNQPFLKETFPNALLLANGRQCVVALIKQYGWKRMWVPEYFCYEVLSSIKSQTNISFVFYKDYPGNNDDETIKSLPFQKNDVLLRINYFGTRDCRNNKGIPIPVIEDHSHDLLGNWAINSDADWCIASLRKSIPIPEGGIVWSPKGLHLQFDIQNTTENKLMAVERWEAMRMKSDYLNGFINDKQQFRAKYIQTEEMFDTASLSGIDEKSQLYLNTFDFKSWQLAKRNNWLQLRNEVNANVNVLLPDKDSGTPFSFVIISDNYDKREKLRKHLITSNVYPAVLWEIPNQQACIDIKNFSQRMLSIHCDGRYSEEDISKLAGIINESIQND